LRIREKAHTREGDAIAAARRRLRMVEVDGATPLIGERGAITLLDAFEGRRMLVAYYFMWHNAARAAIPSAIPPNRSALSDGCAIGETKLAIGSWRPASRRTSKSP
jgi:predicted dithiol-disulfide oxidoreductase (DUF899 family)